MDSKGDCAVAERFNFALEELANERREHVHKRQYARSKIALESCKLRRGNPLSDCGTCGWCSPKLERRKHTLCGSVRRACVRVTMTTTEIGINGMAHVMLTCASLQRRRLSTAGSCLPSA